MEIKDKVWCLFEQSGTFKNEFKTRSTESLRSSKELEKQVDDEIARVNKILSEKQMKQ